MAEKDRHPLYIDIAHRVAQESHAQRLKVGAIIVKNGRIISMGWNGTPTGWDNNCEDRIYPLDHPGGWLSPEEIEEMWPFEDENGNRYKLATKPEVLHAEMNALMKVARSTDSCEDSTLYCTLSPCIDCAKAIHQSGIKRVVYEDDYRVGTGLDFLAKCGIEIIKYTNQDNNAT